MIIQKLQHIFWYLELAAFEQWKLASEEEKERITEKLGVFEAEMILKEIDKEVKCRTGQNCL